MELRNFRYVVLLIVGALFGCARGRSHQLPYFRAAVYEHRRIDEDNTVTSEAAVQANLEFFERAAGVARQQGADIILYPEYALFPASSNRSEIRQYLEAVPNPKEVTVNPCDEAEQFADRPIMYKLSCTAKINSIVIVANMGGLEICEGERECPEDGELHYNTNVAFDKNGTLLARYYKEHLYFEMSMDLPREEQDPIFETEFGKFAMFICFDIVYKKMAFTSRLQEVDAILFSTMWFNSFPFYTSTQWFQAWAMGNNATLLASNIQIPGYSLSGSGIFRGIKGSVVHSLNPDGTSKLMVATLPKRNQDISPASQLTAIWKNGTGEVRGDGTDVPKVCSYGILGMTEDIYSDYRCINEIVANYTLVKLNDAEDHVGVCNNNMCCELEYIASSMNESFYLGVYNGSIDPYSSNRYFWAEENCFLARCDDVNGTACSHFPTMSDTFFHKISLTSNFTTKYVYPSFMSNGMKLVPVDDWTFSSKYDASTIEMNSSSGKNIIAATLKGREFGRDPPFVR